MWQKKAEHSCDFALVALIPLSFYFALSDIDLQRHMPDLVNVIGWKDMRMIALSGGIQKTEIDNCQLSHQTDVNEQTMALLDIYIERQGRGAGQKLRDSLLKRGKKNKAQEVEHILLQDGRNHCSVWLPGLGVGSPECKSSTAGICRLWVRQKWHLKSKAAWQKCAKIWTTIRMNPMSWAVIWNSHINTWNVW